MPNLNKDTYYTVASLLSRRAATEESTPPDSPTNTLGFLVMISKLACCRINASSEQYWLDVGRNFGVIKVSVITSDVEVIIRLGWKNNCLNRFLTQDYQLVSEAIRDRDKCCMEYQVLNRLV